MTRMVLWVSTGCLEVKTCWGIIKAAVGCSCIAHGYNVARLPTPAPLQPPLAPPCSCMLGQGMIPEEHQVLQGHDTGRGRGGYMHQGTFESGAPCTPRQRTPCHLLGTCACSIERAVAARPGACEQTPTFKLVWVV